MRKFLLLLIAFLSLTIGANAQNGLSIDITGALKGGPILSGSLANGDVVWSGTSLILQSATMTGNTIVNGTAQSFGAGKIISDALSASGSSSAIAAALSNTGTSAGTLAAGNDSRLLSSGTIHGVTTNINGMQFTQLTGTNTLILSDTLAFRTSAGVGTGNSVSFAGVQVGSAILQSNGNIGNDNSTLTNSGAFTFGQVAADSSGNLFATSGTFPSLVSSAATLTGTTVMGGVCVLTDTNGLSTTYAPTANTDTARGNALIAALAASGSGKTVTFGPGNYYFTQTQNTAAFFRTGGYYYGRGARLYVNSSTFVQTAGAQAPNTAFYISGTCTLRDIVFDGGNVSGLTGLWLDTNSGQDLSHLTFKNWASVGLELQDSLGAGVKIPGGILESSQFYHNGTALFIQTGCEYWRVSDCIIDGNTTGIISAAGNTKFSNDEVTENVIGLDITAGANGGHIEFNGGDINHNTSKSIYLEPGVIESVGFAGTHCYGNGTTSGYIDLNGTNAGMDWVGGIIAAPFESTSGTISGINSFTGVAIDTTVVWTAPSIALLTAPQLAQIKFYNCVTGTSAWQYNSSEITTDATLVTNSGTTSVSSTQRLSGGTINGMVIGGTTAAAGTFTAVTTTAGPATIVLGGAQSSFLVSNLYERFGIIASGATKYWMQGYGYSNGTSYCPVVSGFQENDDAGFTDGDFIIATRSVTTDTTPAVTFRQTFAGNMIESGSGTFGSNISLTAAGSGLIIKSGANCRIGTGTLTSGAVTVPNSTITANSLVFITDTTSGALTNVGTLVVSGSSAGTSFTVTSTNPLDTSTFNYQIIEKQ